MIKSTPRMLGGEIPSGLSFRFRLEVMKQSGAPNMPVLAKCRLTVSATPQSKPFVIRNFSFREAAPTIMLFLERGTDIRIEAVEGVDTRIADGLRKIAKKHRPELFRRQNGLCAKCGQGRLLTIHHRITISDGGTSDIENLELICHSCHVGIHKSFERLGLDVRLA